ILASEREVLISVPVYRSTGWQGGTAVAAPTPESPCSCGGSCADTECLRGYHAIVLTGYDDATMEFSFLNSWGKDWGDGGYGTVTYEFVQSYGRGGGYLEDVDTSIMGNACGEEPNPCADNGDCAACTAVSGCGWCGDDGGSCQVGGESAPAEGSCGDWRPVTCDAAADPCASNGDCASCAAAAGCAWCGGTTGSCFSLLGRTNFCSDPRTTAEECGDCDGSDCIGCAGASACGWCDGRCVVGGSLGAE
ncbi:MAG: hypothetical protein GWN84_16555, partial [Gammaproteobacteria bacterium]|nr:hypothetical protein [Gammaproteobacteria bacterium]NIR84459.1 hypothetical protein [Gammaproteobacteria bacterium]NIR88768.1 hypothetical protein [Gammaproteobacteria bacterium]NIU05497.1 hypothetical protein [Gammaproteobacteria bacterium]NIV52643.1 hypothetical protein [Gammaproteobacteria bacterium]